MRDAERGEFLRLIADVHGFWKQDVNDFALEVWWSALKPFDLIAVKDALGRHVVNPDAGQFMPKPADVVRMLQGRTADSAMIAWSKVDRAVRMVGTYSSVVFDDPLIHRVLVDMGGWIPFGTKVEDEWPFVQREFEMRYRGYKMRSASPQYPGHLIGISEAENMRAGRKVTEPVLLGEQAKAMLVLRAGEELPAIVVTPLTKFLPRPQAA